MTTPISVLVVDDSDLSIELITHIISSSPDLKVIGTAKNGQEALKFLKYQQPDVITLDIHMPVLDGYETTEEILKQYAIPILILTGSFLSKDTEKTFKALAAGAVGILRKPVGPSDANFSIQAQKIIDTIKMVSEIKVFKRYSSPALIKPVAFKSSEQKVEAIGIGASFGGPQALKVLFNELPATLSVPIFVALHIAPGFVEGLISWLKQEAHLKLAIAKEGEIPLPGHVYFPPDGCHIEILQGRVIHTPPSTDGEPCPSINRLFHSMARTYGANCMGVILTGMGQDGAKELFQLRKRGAFTLVESEETCLIPGISREAIKIGAASRIAPLNEIASIIQQVLLR